MFDEDLQALHGMLRRMEPMAKVSIGHFTCCTSELFWVIEEAMSARAQARSTGTFVPYRSVSAD